MPDNKQKDTVDQEKLTQSHQEERSREGSQEIGEVKEDYSAKIAPLELERIKKHLEDQEVSPALDKEAAKKAEKLIPLQESQKIEELLETAKKEGVLAAITAAKKIDGFQMDKLHDTLAKNGLFKEFLK